MVFRRQLSCFLLIFCGYISEPVLAQENLLQTSHNLNFDSLPTRWDEGIPMGNGLTGSLLWQKDGKLRLALDRADLWDLRPVKEFEQSKDYSYNFVCDQVLNKHDIKPVLSLIDDRSRLDPAPTKIPAGALEFNITSLGKVKKVVLDVNTAVCFIEWECGAKARFFTHATDHTGRFLFENLPDTLSPMLITPRYEENGTSLEKNSQGKPLTLLGYKNGTITKSRNGFVEYHQQAWGNLSYDIALKWNYTDKHTLEGAYCITSKGTWYSESQGAKDILSESTQTNFTASQITHSAWWQNYWDQSRITLPDNILEKQWYLEMYKFGSASRKNAPPISLQAVWTADNGQTPPWRGDFHSDLNTQLSYWPGYGANHLVESSVFTDWLWKIQDNSKEFTLKFFGVEGMNVPCVATLTGKAIGGWSPYSHSPSTAGWLVQHFYLQWKYGMDKTFLKEQAYPWVKEVARYFENVSVFDETGKRKLPLSSSPEFKDNTLEAWFPKTTNYDLANIRLTYTVAAEMADYLGLKQESGHWKTQLKEWPLPAVNETGFMVAPGTPMAESHRHFSHMLSFHPFGLVDVSQGEKSKELILRSIKNVEDLGPDWWTGYTYTWLANLKARVFDGDAASKNLHIFIKAFCSPNSFHLNGDQTKSGYSKFTYRPFTLEGNFACATAIQEMLLQSHAGVIKVFPAIPSAWKNASFRNLRAMGAFLISADYKNAKVEKIVIVSEKGGKLKIDNPFTGKITELNTKANEIITLK